MTGWYIAGLVVLAIVNLLNAINDYKQGKYVYAIFDALILGIVLTAIFVILVIK